MNEPVWPFPVVPADADAARASGPLRLPYDDLTQGGQVKLTSLPLAIGRVCFEELWVKSPLVGIHGSGVFPILTRIVLESDANTTLLGAALEGRGAMYVAHEPDAQGHVQALILNMTADVYGPLGRSHGPQLEGAGKQVRIGRVFAEHVFTKPFAPAGERKVLRFDLPGVEPVPRVQHARTRPATLLALPAAATPLDADFTPDIAPWVFGLMHTDHNQHVNSLVYARMFEEAALRRLHEHGQSTHRLARMMELVYRKPCFSGERLSCMLRAFRVGDQLGVVGYLGAPNTPPEKAHCTLRALL